ncbi:hypothetical protein KGQ20_05995 [Catenulispora sp. NF23]|uniref:Secreted protein n=1 Tax=Catenulispora pinistramenti TaxID=2705254 RepID=A0ABS5KIX6_9ACTN|nr:hypothetical protein [Catenulispora pinistramenti]MBS2532319.1 hypothetical protein [Catenulispora pinistramenti]MBS2546088.1 hypothetical protein [Catenulispora pinistramenti]
MKHGHARRTAALTLTAAVTLGGALLTAGPAAAIDRVGGSGCKTNGVTLYVGLTGSISRACYAGSAGTIRDNVSDVGSVASVWNHGYAQYTTTAKVDDVTGFLANGVHYPYDDPDSNNYSVTILP